MTEASCPFCDRLRRLDQLPDDDDVVWQFPESVAFLGPWQYFEGYCVLVCRHHATELHHLPEQRRRQFFDEVCQLGAAIEQTFHPRKLNCESLGNQVPHLHWHLFPRYHHDPDHLQPAWLAVDRAQREAAERERLTHGQRGRADVVAALRARLSSTP